MIQGRHYIDGRWQAAASGRERTVIKHIYRHYETRAIDWFGV